MAAHFRVTDASMPLGERPKIVVAAGGRFHMPWVAKALGELETDVHVWSGRAPTMEFGDRCDVVVRRGVNILRRGGHIVGLPRNIVDPAADNMIGRQIAQYCHRMRPDIVHIWSAYALEAFREMERPLKILESGSFHVEDDYLRLGSAAPPAVRSERWRRRLCTEYELAHRIIVASEAARQSFDRHGLGSKVVVIRYGVDIPAIRDAPKDIDLLFVGNFSHQKGFDTFVEIARIVATSGTRAVAVGRPMDVKLPGRRFPEIEVISPLPRHDLMGIMSRSHWLILPSRQEGFGMVALEAIAGGCLPLVGEMAGVSEVIREVDDRLVLRAQDPTEIANHFESLRRLPPSAREAMLDRGAKAIAGLSWNGYARSCLDLYTLIGG